MAEFMCPGCEELREVEWEYMPERSCDDVLHCCEECGTGMRLGWVAEVEVRSVVVEFGDTVDRSNR